MAGLSVLLPGALVLLDTDDWWCHQPLRGQRGVVTSRYAEPVDGYEYVVCVQPCPHPEHTDRCPRAIAFRADELLPVPPTGYRCCEHCSCPDGATGHPAPCVRCGQPLIDTPDRQVARAMAAGQ